MKHVVGIALAGAAALLATLLLFGATPAAMGALVAWTHGLPRSGVQALAIALPIAGAGLSAAVALSRRRRRQRKSCASVRPCGVTADGSATAG